MLGRGGGTKYVFLLLFIDLSEDFAVCWGVVMLVGARDGDGYAGDGRRGKEKERGVKGMSNCANLVVIGMDG